MSVVLDDDLNEKKSSLKKVTTKKLKNVHMNEPAQPSVTNEVYESIPEANHFYGLVPTELKRNTKGLVTKVLSMPAKHRSKILETKLNQSDYVNTYLSKYMCFDMLGYLNDHVKFAMCYGINFVETMMIPELTPEQLATLRELQNKNNLKPCNNDNDSTNRTPTGNQTPGEIVV